MKGVSIIALRDEWIVGFGCRIKSTMEIIIMMGNVLIQE
jgi:hypothetical protein